jgi:hypothetical protein
MTATIGNYLSGTVFTNQRGKSSRTWDANENQWRNIVAPFYFPWPVVGPLLTGLPMIGFGVPAPRRDPRPDALRR